MAKLAKVLQTEVMGDLSALAKLLQSKGRGKDTILAHITPAEAKKLKDEGGRGSRNPDTGLLEFETDLPMTTVYGTAPSGGGGYDFGFIGSGASEYGGAYGGGGGGGYGTPLDTSTPLTGYAPMGEAAPGTVLGAPQATPTAPGLAAQSGEELGAITPSTERAESKLETALRRLGRYEGLGKLGLTAGMGMLGRKQAAGAAQQAQQYAAQQQALAQPYQMAGQKMVGAAARGEMTPQSQQAYEAARAQMAQAAESRGGVGAQQAATQLEAFRQQLLQNQYTYGLQVANIGDNIALGAIRTGMQADQYVNQATQNFYATLSQFMVGG